VQGQAWPIFERDPTVGVASQTTWWVASPDRPVKIDVTSDGGRHWHETPAVGLPAAPDDLYALDATHGWATVTTSVASASPPAEFGKNYTVEVYRTSNAGRSWTHINLPQSG
jgi:photosystem II stability/assembly factor-like uncharacterized protein